MANKWDVRRQAVEEEYFDGKERKLIEKLKTQSEKERQEKFLETCRMRCPKCGEPLKERSFKKIQIDQCAGCGGIWLDAGELEEVAEREEESWLGKLWQKHRAKSNN
ncbi:MAG: zf-TFIIB domain-containing protein [Deltaproteobacteria bacterium]|nr:zf-TFIIB domain-containing protein [Deltaproteobacteria bacterium]